MAMMITIIIDIIACGRHLWNELNWKLNRNLIFTAYVKLFNDLQIASATVHWQTAHIFLQQQSFLKNTRSLLLAITGWL